MKKNVKEMACSSHAQIKSDGGTASPSSACSVSFVDDYWDHSGEQIPYVETTLGESLGVNCDVPCRSAKAEFYIKDGLEYVKSVFGGGRRVWTLPDGRKTMSNPRRDLDSSSSS
jgi:hypothetical protein